MKLIEEVKTVWYRLWSVRLALLAALLSIAELIVPMLVNDIPHGWFVALSAITAVAAAVARLVAQPAIKADPNATIPGK